MEVTAQDCRDVLLDYCAVALKAVVQRGYLEHVLKNDLFFICLVPRPGGKSVLSDSYKKDSHCR